MEQFAEKFLRFKENGEDPHWFSWDPKFRPKWIRPETLSAQTVPIMEEEIKGRQKNFSCFWRGYDCVPTNYFKAMDGITPTEEACKYDSAIILDMILKANADVSFWKGTQTKIPDSLTNSSLSTLNPILCAIKSRHMEQLQRLLDDGFNPNVMPLVIRQQSYPPIMACFILCDPPNWDAFSTS